MQRSLLRLLQRFVVRLRSCVYCDNGHVLLGRSFFSLSIHLILEFTLCSFQACGLFVSVQFFCLLLQSCVYTHIGTFKIFSSKRRTLLPDHKLFFFMCAGLACRHHEVSVGCLIGGKDVQAEAERIGYMNIIVATPGRLLQHIDESPMWDSSRLLILGAAISGLFLIAFFLSDCSFLFARLVYSFSSTNSFHVSLSFGLFVFLLCLPLLAHAWRMLCPFVLFHAF